MTTRAYRIANVCIRLVQVSAACLLLAPLAYRFSLASLFSAFAALVVGLVICLLILVVALATWFVSRRQLESVRRARLAAFSSLLVLLIPGWFLFSNLDAPPIHHITTDPSDPPEFVAVLALRGANSNPIDYPGGEVEAQQRAAYPDLHPIVIASDPVDVFRRSLKVAESLGWEIVLASEDEGHIEATATTLWFGFKDDVVIRVRSDNGGSRVDLRSVSRVGGGDLGANAARIRAFIDAIMP